MRCTTNNYQYLKNNLRLLDYADMGMESEEKTRNNLVNHMNSINNIYKRS
jgi:hypothetical protein